MSPRCLPLALLGTLAAATRALVALGLPAGASAQLPWPAGPGTEIGHEGQPGGLPSGFEASGVAWHAGRGTLVVVNDNGQVAELSPEGGMLALWPLAGDLEAVAVADPASSRVHVGVEHPDGVVEFDLATGLPTGASWNLTPWMTGPSNEGLEALACVDGVFHAGLQADGTIFRFVLGAGGAVQFLGSVPSHLGRTDLAALDFDACTGVLLALHDTANVLVEYDAAGAFLREYVAAGSDQEGVALRGGSPGTATRLFLAQDTGEVLRFESWPVAPCAPGTWTDLGGGTAGSAGPVTLAGGGPLQGGWPVSLELAGAPPGAPLLALISFASVPKAAFGGTLHALPAAAQLVLAADASGAFSAAAAWPAGLPPGTDVWFQFLVQDAAVAPPIALSNALRATTP
jgi:hypothetical protein